MGKYIYSLCVKLTSLFPCINHFTSKGFGTAIGELPPYFMARGARLSGKLRADEIEVSPNGTSSSSEHESEVSAQDGKLNVYQRLELFLQRLVTRAGFFGIMLCASVSNISVVTTTILNNVAHSKPGNKFTLLYAHGKM